MLPRPRVHGKARGAGAPGTALYRRAPPPAILRRFAHVQLRDPHPHPRAVPGHHGPGIGGARAAGGAGRRRTAVAAGLEPGAGQRHRRTDQVRAPGARRGLRSRAVGDELRRCALPSWRRDGRQGLRLQRLHALRLREQPRPGAAPARRPAGARGRAAAGGARGPQARRPGLLQHHAARLLARRHLRRRGPVHPRTAQRQRGARRGHAPALLVQALQRRPPRRAGRDPVAHERP